MIIIPFYINENIAKSKYNNYCKLLLTCINSYYYNGNDLDLEVVTNDKKIVKMLNRMDKPLSIKQVDSEFFQTVKAGSLDNDVPSLQTMVKLSVLCNYSSGDVDVLLDFDTLFLSKVDFEQYDIVEDIELFTNTALGFSGKTIRQMITHGRELFPNLKAKWKNSGVVLFRECKKLIENNLWVYNENTIKYSDEFLLNYIDIECIDDNKINIPPVDRIGNYSKEGLIHFFNPWFKPYIVEIDENKEFKIGITTDHKLDYIPSDYFDELMSYRMYHNNVFLYYCFQWWYYYGDVMGNIGDEFNDFRYYDSNYFKHLIEKLF